MKKILLALQFWEGDRKQAMQTARLIADLEPKFSERADFLFVARFDTEQDPATIEHVSKKFNVLHFTNKWRRGREWPHGCNEQWFGTMDYVYSMMEAKKLPDYKAVLTFEADTCALTPNWLAPLSAAWDKAKVKVMGSLQTSPGLHMNGNAFFSTDPAFMKWITRDVSGCTPHGGWDYVLAKDFKRWGWADCPLMRSWWQTRTMTQETFEQLTREGVVFFHGIKDGSLARLVRQRFLP